MKDVVLKVTNLVKKYDNICFIILIFLSIYGITLNIKIISSDELWNFQNVYKMYNGFKIYSDANVIVTPLFFFIGKIMLQIFGANLLTFRIYNIIITILFYFVSYLIFKQLKISKKLSIIGMLCFLIFDNYYVLKGQANYNILAFTFCLIGVLLNIKNYKYNKYFQGIILFLIMATKQNVGIFYLIGLITYEIAKKNNIKDKIKNLMISLFICLFFVALLLVYFLKNGILCNFFDLAFFGIGEFASQNIKIKIIGIIVLAFAVIVNLFLTVFFIKNKKVSEIQKENLIVLQCFSVPLILFIVPIANTMHLLHAIYLPMILFIYQIIIILKASEIKIDSRIVQITFVLFSIMDVFSSTYNFILWANTINSDEYSIKKEDAFYGGIIRDDLKKSIDNVVQYMKDNSNKVIVLSNKAAFYTILTKTSNGIMDLPFKGNLGKGGEGGLIKKIKNLHNTEILIEKSEDEVFWQESKIVREYIINNMEKVGEIEEFYIYK